MMSNEMKMDVFEAIAAQAVEVEIFVAQRVNVDRALFFVPRRESAAVEHQLYVAAIDLFRTLKPEIRAIDVLRVQRQHAPGHLRVQLLMHVVGGDPGAAA
jgi:hypothetical protein